MNKITIYQPQRNGDTTFRRWEMHELVEEIRGSRFMPIINPFRRDYPLLQRDFGAQRNAIIEHRLQDIPFICFAQEMGKQNGKDRIYAHNPLLLMTVGNLRNEEMAERLRNLSAQLPYTRLAFVGADGHSIHIVCELMPLGKELSTDEDYRELHRRGFKMMRKVYADHLHATVDTNPELPVCRMSYDQEAYLNPNSSAFHIDMLSPAPEILSGDVCYIPAQVEDREERNNWRRIFIDNLRKAQNEELTSDDADFELLMTLARYCHETGMPQALAERFTLLNGEFCHEETLVRDTFSAEYDKELRSANPQKHLNQTALLMLRTSQFLNVHFRLRRNVLNDVVEYRLNDGSDFDYHTLTKEVQNTMTLMALESGLPSWDKDLNRYINSKRIPEYDPINDWLNALPKWDGMDRITAIAQRVPTDTPNWEHNFHVWMLSMVAQWMGRDDQHGNAIAPILIGGQNTGKTSFCRTILPEHLLEYYNDSIDFKDDKGVYLALSSFALINIDEFDSLTKRQQPLMKYLLSKADVKFRGAYKSFIEQHKRYASFIGTTNNPHPLSDPTGSRRFICVNVIGEINHMEPIDYEQVYAQLREEVMRGDRYWFTKEEADLITLQNSVFQKHVSLEAMIHTLYTQPAEDESIPPTDLETIASTLLKAFPGLDLSGDINMKMGKPMKKLGFAQVRKDGIRQYLVKKR